MPKKLYSSEPPIIFQELYRAALTSDRDFLVRTTDPTPPSFAAKLIDEHYPPQSQLPLDDD